MTEPLALFLYQKLLPSGQLVNRFQDLGYRVQSIGTAAHLVEHAEREKPLLVLADLEPAENNVVSAISNLRANAATAHIPVIAFGAGSSNVLLEQAREAGATLVVTDAAILAHLQQFIEQALAVE